MVDVLHDLTATVHQLTDTWPELDDDRKAGRAGSGRRSRAGVPQAQGDRSQRPRHLGPGGESVGQERSPAALPASGGSIRCGVAPRSSRRLQPGGAAPSGRSALDGRWLNQHRRFARHSGSRAGARVALEHDPPELRFRPCHFSSATGTCAPHDDARSDSSSDRRTRVRPYVRSAADCWTTTGGRASANPSSSTGGRTYSWEP